MKMEMTNKNKQEDKKAIKKFVLVLILSAFAGGIIGFATTYLRFRIGETGDILKGRIGFVLAYSVPFVTLLVAGYIFSVCKKVKKSFALWDGENEAAADKMEEKLSVGLWLSNINMIWNYFAFITVYSENGFNNLWKENQQGVTTAYAVLFISFIAGIVFMIAEQQKLVNLTKEISPEKKGSVYDLRFQKKWEESCDEAELFMVYKSAYHAYRMTNRTCMALWLVVACLGMTWDIGVLPAIIVSLIWAVLVSSYCFETFRLSRKK